MDITFGDLISVFGQPLCTGRVNFNDSFSSVCTDTRKLEEGCLFVPLIGSKFNGHDFLKEAYKKGAKAAIISEKHIDKTVEGFVLWVVRDTLEAYQQLASYVRGKLSIPVVAVTGSVGKTTTRQLIRAALQSLGSIASTYNNNNNDVGVALTLLDGKLNDALYVVEMGMRGLGEIERLSFCARPDIAVITNIGTSHIGLLGSRSNIAKAKCEITTYMNPNGVVIIPFGEPLLETALKDKWNGRTIRVAVEDRENTNNCFKSNHLCPDYIGHLSLDEKIICFDGVNLNLPLEGRHNAQNFMLTLAVAKEFDVSINTLRDLKVEMPEGRNRVVDLGSIIVMDETYNSSPESLKASLKLLASKPGRHFAVIGSMMELGDQSLHLHNEVADLAVELGLDGLVMVSQGEEANVVESVAKQLSNFAVVPTAEKAMSPLLSWLKPGDVVLLKASRSIRLEKLLKLLVERFS